MHPSFPLPARDQATGSAATGRRRNPSRSVEFPSVVAPVTTPSAIARIGGTIAPMKTAQCNPTTNDKEF